MKNKDKAFIRFIIVELSNRKRTIKQKVKDLIKRIILKLSLKIKIMRKISKKIINRKDVDKDVRKEKYLTSYLSSIIAIRKFHRFKFDNKLIFAYNFNHFFNHILSIIALKEIRRY